MINKKIQKILFMSVLCFVIQNNFLVSDTFRGIGGVFTGGVISLFGAYKLFKEESSQEKSNIDEYDVSFLQKSIANTKILGGCALTIVGACCTLVLAKSESIAEILKW